MRRHRWIVAVTLMLLLGAAIAYGIAELVSVQDDIEDSRRDRADLRSELAGQHEISTALAEQVRALGEEPVVEPSDPPTTAPILQGERGPIGPRGPAGLPGLPGVDGTDGEPGAVGADGEPGAVGESGATGAQGEPGASGAQGPAGATGPQGEPGAQGPVGPAGADGRGIASVTCAGLPGGATWTFTYTDGTTQSVACATPEPSTDPTAPSEETP